MMYSIRKKIRKLVRDPKAFFVDLAQKRVPEKIWPKYGVACHLRKKQGHFQYVIISAVYNLEEYLGDYFLSIVGQSLNFKSNIRVVMVDDGSTDGSSVVIKKWQSLYPDNIFYIYKENGGQSSARNVGIDFTINNMESDWITFIDPDDFLNINYFYRVDSFLCKSGPLSMVSTYNIQFYEENSKKSDSHFLRHRFAQGSFVVPAYGLGGYMQFSASTCFFLADQVKASSVRFDERVRPCFEDAHFVGSYLLSLDGGMAAFVREAKYYARKRKNKTSTMDNAPRNKGRYLDVLEYGCLNLLNMFKSAYGFIPDFVQKTVFIELFWAIRPIIEGDIDIGFLSREEKERLHTLCCDLMSLINSGIVEYANFKIRMSWWHKTGMLACFKGVRPSEEKVFISDYDPIKSQILISYFSKDVPLEAFFINGTDVIPDHTKSQLHRFMGEQFVIERRVWLPIPVYHEDKVLEVFIEGKRASLFVRSVKVNGALSDIVKSFNANPHIGEKNSLWLFMDRSNGADDNAEHLYRYIRQYHPEKNVGFLLEQGCADWERLKDEGFNLIPFGTQHSARALKKCTKFIASFDNKYIRSYILSPSFNKRHFVWLDHGIIRNNTFSYHNKKPISLFITAAKPTYDFVSSDMSQFRYTKKEACITGLARHDNLLKSDVPTENMILICPTWRKYLEKTDDFPNTLYAKTWVRLLGNDRFLRIIRDHGYKVIFLPHHMLGQYLEDFNISPEIEVRSYEDGPLQVLFKKAAFLITDYSSISMEFGYLRKPVIYYQFDKEDFFSSHHQEGYFLDSRDGFGPAVEEENEVLAWIEEFVTKGAVLDTLYSRRMEDFFSYRDGKCCERIYQKICELDEPRRPGYLNIDILRAYAEKASAAGDIRLARSRWTLLLDTLKNRSWCPDGGFSLEDDMHTIVEVERVLTSLSDCET